MRVNIWIPDRLLEEIDKHCKKEGLTRSAFLKEAALSGLTEKDFDKVIKKMKKQDRKYVVPKKQHFSKLLGKEIEI
jgi:metal-responsive CopG/Arc/MetJ family transcriptional regulator